MTWRRSVLGPALTLLVLSGMAVGHAGPQQPAPPSFDPAVYGPRRIIIRRRDTVTHTAIERVSSRVDVLGL